MIGGGVAAGATIYGSKKQSRANDQALAYEREQEARRRQEYDQQQMELRRQWDATETRRAPYRAASEATLRDILASRGRSMPTVIPSTGKTLGSLAGGY